jgi:hypothetical protein
MQHALKLSFLVFSIILLHLVMSEVSSEEKSAASSHKNAAAAEEGFSEARTLDADIKLKEGKQPDKNCYR